MRDMEPIGEAALAVTSFLYQRLAHPPNPVDRLRLLAYYRRLTGSPFKKPVLRVVPVESLVLERALFDNRDMGMGQAERVAWGIRTPQTARIGSDHDNLVHL